MNPEERNKTLFEQAKRLRMCDEVHKAWYGKTLGVDELFDLYYRNFDFCTEYRWPHRNTVRELFSDEERHSHGFVADEKWSLLNPTHSVILGASDAKIRYNGFSVARTDIMDNSHCEISIKGHAIVSVHVYDTARVSVNVEDKGSALIVRHSKKCRCAAMGQATIKECI